MRIETYLRLNHPIVWRTGIVKAAAAAIVFGAFTIFLAHLLNQAVTLDDLLVDHVAKTQNAKILLDLIVLGGVIFWITRVRRFQLPDLSLRLIARSFVLFLAINLMLFLVPLQVQVISVETVSRLVPGAIDAVRTYETAEGLALGGGVRYSEFESDLAGILGDDYSLHETDVSSWTSNSWGNRINPGDRLEMFGLYENRSLSGIIRFDLFERFVDSWIERSTQKAYVIASSPENSSGSNMFYGYELLGSLAEAQEFFDGQGFIFSACVSLLLAVFSSVLLCAASFGVVSGRIRIDSPIYLVKQKLAKVFASLEHLFSRRFPLFWLLGAHRSVVEFLFSLVVVVPIILGMIVMIDPFWDENIESIYIFCIYLLIPILYLWDWFSRQSNIYQVYTKWGTIRVMLASIFLVSPIILLTLLVVALGILFQIPAHDPMFGRDLDDETIIVAVIIAVFLCAWASPMLVMATQKIRYLRAIYILSSIGFVALLMLIEMSDDVTRLIGIVIVVISLLFLFYPPQRAGQPGKALMVIATSSALLNALYISLFMESLVDLIASGDMAIVAYAFIYFTTWFLLVAIYIYQINRINLVPGAAA